METNFNTDILKGKTIDRIEDDTIYFTDGYSLRLYASHDYITEDDTVCMELSKETIG